mmetsp:Transcript_16754/g.54539  ORF Transcript_16754/g.54539 Transcript_16754/m.54539 type:complete len:206 (-) Transcript_16754:126-743(-)
MHRHRRPAATLSLRPTRRSPRRCAPRAACRYCRSSRRRRCGPRGRSTGERALGDGLRLYFARHGPAGAGAAAAVGGRGRPPGPRLRQLVPPPSGFLAAAAAASRLAQPRSPFEHDRSAARHLARRLVPPWSRPQRRPPPSRPDLPGAAAGRGRRDRRRLGRRAVHLRRGQDERDSWRLDEAVRAPLRLVRRRGLHASCFSSAYGD